MIMTIVITNIYQVFTTSGTIRVLHSIIPISPHKNLIS